ncbi:MAG: hypothetical protein E7057_09360 [Lentisphaerae bacterium]|nr:hypothetical protein [Lentisphaerota bacterium]
MAERYFTGRISPAAAVAGAVAALKAESVPDFGQILLVLPGEAARRSVQSELLKLFPGGLLLPQFLTPRQFMHYQDECSTLPDPVSEELLWGEVFTSAARTPEKFPYLFTGKKVPADKFLAGSMLRQLRLELAAGGFSIGETAEFFGERGSELAELESRYTSLLKKYHFTDPLTCDRMAVNKVEMFADAEKIILAGMPDIPRMIRQKLAVIDQQFPGKLAIWIGDDESNRDCYDQWGTAIAEAWQKKAFHLPLKNIHTAIDPADAARRAVKLAELNGVFNTAECAVVLADPALYPQFAGEFSRLHDINGNAVVTADPGGVPFSLQRLYGLLQLLHSFLKEKDDFFTASSLLRHHDYLLYAAKDQHGAEKLLTVLDKFQLQYTPDTFEAASELAVEEPRLKNAFDKLRHLQELFEAEPLPEFLRKFLMVIYRGCDDPAELFNTIPFDRECSFMREQLKMLENIPEALTRHTDKLQLFESFLRYCGNQKITMPLPENAVSFEGCLEMPFLTHKRIIFCGMNERYFPDRIELTPFLTDSIRRKIGIRSNIQTLARALSHLQSVKNSRGPGDLQLIVLRRDSEKSALRPSGILFGGEDLSDAELLERTGKLFKDPEEFLLPPPAAKDLMFQLDLPLDYRKEADGRLRLAVTDLDQYLSSPLEFFLARVQNSQTIDYAAEEPDGKLSGTLCHQAFEALGSARFPTEESLREHLLAAFDRATAAHYKTLPVLVKLFAANMHQRLSAAAAELFAEQSDGFEVLAVEYHFGGEANCIEYAGAVFRGSIDRIEINRPRRLIRLIDIKTGKVKKIVAEHCSTVQGRTVFKKLQLPLYALLLKEDQNFWQTFALDPAEYTIDCAYLVVPRSVTDTELQVWEAEEFRQILPAAADKVREIIAEILRLPEREIRENPKRIDNDLLQPDAEKALRNINWIIPESQNNDNSDGGTPNAPDFPEHRKVFPGVNPNESAGMTRCCSCPPAISARCTCYRGDCTSCKSFNGFKDFCIISASAGTGKTYALASRFIQLLSFGAAPDSILALTFTKAAAGEIFDRIVKRLGEMALLPDLPQNRCIRQGKTDAAGLLRSLLAPGSRNLQIGTIDSFFMQILQAFAPELGIWGKLNMIPEKDDRFIRRVLRSWINNISDETELNILRELLKDANASETRNFNESMHTLLAEVYPWYLQNLAGVSGDFDSTLESPALWFPSPEEVFTPESCIQASDQLRGMAQNIEERSAVIPNRTTSRSMKTLARRLLMLANDLDKSRYGFLFGKLDGDVQELFKAISSSNAPYWCDEKNPLLNYNKNITFSPEESKLICRVFRHIRALSMLQMRQKGKAVFSLMAEFDRFYAALVRNNGNLTFSDLTALLLNLDKETGEIILGSPDRSLEYRLDAGIMHYMFDEFQDTSDFQFMVFDPLLRELFSSRSEFFRSFFCVGDLKQSIYQWRGGNPALFRYVTGKLAAMTDDPEQSLTRSYRSSQIVLDMVNAVFAPYHGDGKTLPGFAETLAMMKFENHSTARELTGHAALLEVKPLPRSSQNIPAKALLIARMLSEISPLERKLTVGILVQTNKNAREFAGELRKVSALPISIDGKISPVESMAFNVFKELLILSEHPDDKQAENFLSSVVLAAPDGTVKVRGKDGIAQKLNLKTGIPLNEALRHELFFRKLSGFAAHFCDTFIPEVTASERRQLEILRNVAGNFSGSIAEFLRQVQNTGETGNALADTIQIMTVHKSKGLEFDIVFLPDTGNPGGNHVKLTPESAVVNCNDSDAGSAKPEWISYMPPEALSVNTPVFREHLETLKINEAFAKCCKLYVAMTRARRALYLLTSCTSSGDTLSMDKVLKNRLPEYGIAAADVELPGKFNIPGFTPYPAELYCSHGKWEWFLEHPVISKTSADKSEATVNSALPAVQIPQLTIRRASDSKNSPALKPELLFNAVSGTDTGNQVHWLFEKLSFIDRDFDAGAFAAANNTSPIAAKIFTAAMKENSPIREIFYRQSGDCELWREKRFIRQDENGVIIPGAFDRVLIHRENGRAVRAEIYDFKSDNFASAEEYSIYISQMTSYQHSLAKLLDLPLKAVSCHICALKIKEVIHTIIP